MRPGKLSLAVVAMVGVLLGLGAEALAAGGAESCLVTSQSLLAGRATIRGAAVVELINYLPGNNTADRADATLTLTYQTRTAVFRAHIAPASILSPEQVMCDIINANPKATVLVNNIETELSIFQVFGFPTPAVPSDSLKLCLVINKNQNVTCQSVEPPDFHRIPNTASDFTGATILTIYVFN